MHNTKYYCMCMYIANATTREANNAKTTIRKNCNIP